MPNSWIGNYSFFRARIDSSREAVYDLDTETRYTYGDLERRANLLARYLKEQAGVRKGDRVAFIARNCIEMIDAYYATGKLGAIFVPYNARLSVSELVQLVNNETPKVLFYEEVFADKIPHLKSGCSVEKYLVLSPGKNPENDATYAEATGHGNDAFVGCDELDIEDIHMIIHTGGTTGLPKGGLISHRCELFNCLNEICTWNLHHEDSTLLLLPLFHTGGWNLLTLPLLHVGGRLVINRQFDPKKTLEIVEKERITTLFGAATIFRMMVELPEFASADFSSVKWIMAGAAPTPVNIMEKFWNKGVKFVLGYGMTEAGPNNISSCAHLISDDVMKAKYASVGKPMYLSMVKLADDDGNEITAPNTPASCCGAGRRPSPATGTTRRDGEDAEGRLGAFGEHGGARRGWLLLHRRPEEEHVHQRRRERLSAGDRAGDVRHRGDPRGLRLWRSRREVGRGGQGRRLAEARKRVSKEEIVAALGSKLARYKIPKYIAFVDEVPKNNVGKIVVSKVVELYGRATD